MLLQSSLHTASGPRSPPCNTQVNTGVQRSSRTQQQQYPQAIQLLTAPAAVQHDIHHQHSWQQQQHAVWQQQQQVLPGRSMHSQQTNKLLLLLQTATGRTAAAELAGQQQHGLSSSDRDQAQQHDMQSLVAMQQQRLWPVQRQHMPADAALLVHEIQHCTKPQQLLAFLSTHAVDVDAVAASAAIVHYARLVAPNSSSSSNGSSSSSSSRPSGGSHLLPWLLQHLLLVHISNFKPRQFANTLYALGRMHCRDKGLVTRLLQGLGPSVVTQLKPQELANVAWGLGRLRVWPNAAWLDMFYAAVAVQLQQQQQRQRTPHRLRQQQQQRRRLFKPQELSNLVWGLGRLHAVPPKPWLQILLPELERNAPGFSAQQLSNVVWGLAQMGGSRPKPHTTTSSSSSSSSSSSDIFPADELAGFLSKVSEAAQCRLTEFNVQELSCLVSGVATLRQQQQQQEARGVPNKQAAAVDCCCIEQQQLLELQLAEAACWQLAAAAATVVNPAAAAVASQLQQQQQRCRDSQQPCGADSKLSNMRIQQPQRQRRCQQQQQQQWRAAAVRPAVQPSNLSMVLHGYVTLQQQQQQQRLPPLPQPLLQQLSAVLEVHSVSQSSSSSSGGALHYRTLRSSEVPGFCSSMLLLTQLGFTPTAGYMTAMLEVLHDKLHLLNPKDFVSVVSCLKGLSYMPSKPWVVRFLQAACPRFGKFSPEVLAQLLLWALTAERWFSKAADTSDNNNSSSSGRTGSLIARSSVQRQQQQQGVGVRVLSGLVVQDGCVVTADWVLQLVIALRAKVGCRARLANAPDGSSHAAAAAAAAEPASLLDDMHLLDAWLRRQLQLLQVQQ